MKEFTFLSQCTCFISCVALCQAVEPPNVYQIGNRISVGTMSYAVLNAKWTARLTDNQLMDSPPDAAFLILELQVTNIDLKPRTIPPFKLVDENGA